MLAGTVTHHAVLISRRTGLPIGSPSLIQQFAAGAPIDVLGVVVGELSPAEGAVPAQGLIEDRGMGKRRSERMPKH